MSLSIEQFMLPCLNKKLFGFECFGCGLQRSALLLFKGSFVEAFHMYPAIYTLVLLFSVVIADKLFNFKYANKLIVLLAITNVVVIVGSYAYKHFL